MKVERVCRNCKKKFFARSADVKRGWAIYCSKRCKAVAQERRTGQYQELMMTDCERNLGKFESAYWLSWIGVNSGMLRYRATGRNKNNCLR